MEVVLLGTGAAWPDAHRGGPAFLFVHEGAQYLIDCGCGTSQQFAKAGYATSDTEHIFFTHMHIDHCVEFPAFVFGAYITGKEGKFNVYGPTGTKHFTDSIFNDTYNFANGMLKNIRDKDILIETKETNEGAVYEGGGVLVEAALVEHGQNALAYKFSADGKSVVFSGDTAPCENIVEISKGADLLLLECSFPEDFGRKPGHCTPSDVGKIAAEAGVKEVALIHMFPPCRGKEDEIVAEVQKHYSGIVRVGNDLDVIKL